jgi:hypothetical protein
LLVAPRRDPHERSLAHAALIADELTAKPAACPHTRHLLDTRNPAQCRERVRWKSVLLDQQPSLLTLRRRAFRLCSNDSSVLCRCPTPRRRARGPYGLSLLPPSCHYVSTGISEVSRFSCMKYLGVSGVFDYAGLKQELALAPLIMLPAAITRASASGLHLFGAQYPPHLFPCLRFAVHLTMPSAKLGAEWIASPFS